MSNEKVCPSGHVFSPGDELCSRCNAQPINQEAEVVDVPVKDEDPAEPEDVSVEPESAPENAEDGEKEPPAEPEAPAVTELPPAE